MKLALVIFIQPCSRSCSITYNAFFFNLALWTCFTTSVPWLKTLLQSTSHHPAPTPSGDYPQTLDQYVSLSAPVLLCLCFSQAPQLYSFLLSFLSVSVVAQMLPLPWLAHGCSAQLPAPTVAGLLLPLHLKNSCSSNGWYFRSAIVPSTTLILQSFGR